MKIDRLFFTLLPMWKLLLGFLSRSRPELLSDERQHREVLEFRGELCRLELLRS